MVFLQLVEILAMVVFLMCNFGTFADSEVSCPNMAIVKKKMGCILKPPGSSYSRRPSTPALFHRRQGVGVIFFNTSEPQFHTRPFRDALSCSRAERWPSGKDARLQIHGFVLKSSLGVLSMLSSYCLHVA